MFVVTESGKLFRESIFKDYEETRDQLVLSTGWYNVNMNNKVDRDRMEIKPRYF